MGTELRTRGLSDAGAESEGHDASLQICLDDDTLFGNDAAEDENRSVLMSYFVDQPAFSKFLDRRRRLMIATGRKGMGKSALLVRCAELLRSEDAEGTLVVKRVPSQLVALREPPNTEDHSLLENYWKQVICGAINMELAERIGFAWTDNQLALVESAELAGFTERNLVGSLMSRLVSKIKMGAVELAPVARPSANHEELLKRVDRERGKSIWFLLDDLDAKFQNTARQQAFISAFLPACRSLVTDTQGIGIRATLRSDVWASLTSTAEDIDKVEQYRTKIQWSATQQTRLLAQRILAYAQRVHPESDVAKHWDPERHADELIQLAFAERMRWGRSLVPAEHVVRILAGGRPRWMAQLCRDAGSHAANRHAKRIEKRDVDQAMTEFGTRRLSDLYKEYQYQFANLRQLVECFAGGPRRFTTQALLDWIGDRYTRRVQGADMLMIDGAPFKEDLQLARMLYKCGFINGSNEAPDLARPEFIGFDVRPDLLKVETNLDDGMAWEVQPAYRNVLGIR